jgi:hypothetical protein
MFNGRQMMTNGMSLHDITEMGIRSKAHAASNPFPK